MKVPISINHNILGRVILFLKTMNLSDLFNGFIKILYVINNIVIVENRTKEETTVLRL